MTSVATTATTRIAATRTRSRGWLGRVGELEDRRPAGTPHRAALVGDDRKKPRPDGGVLAQPVEASPGFQRGLLDSVLRLIRIPEEDHRQPERRSHQGPHKGIE